MGLTDNGIKALKPRGDRYFKSDGRGLYLGVMPTPSDVKSWVYRYTLKGKAEKLWLGNYPDVSLADARAIRDTEAAKVREGRSPAFERKLAKAGTSTSPTVREFGERYYKEVVTKARKNPKDIRRYLDNEIYPSLGGKLLKDVDALDVQSIVYRKRDNGRVAAAMQLRNVMKGMFDYALEVQLVTINPAAMVATRFIGKARKRDRVLAPNEIRLYLRTIYQSNIRRQFKLALHIILLTLVRKSELLLSKWEYIDFEAGEWLIPKENSKNGKPHVIYISTQVADMFRELKALAGESEFVLPGRDGHGKKPFAHNALNKAADVATETLTGKGVRNKAVAQKLEARLSGVSFDMEPFTIHDLRRTSATRLRDNGFPRDVVEKALNHVPKGIEGVYNLAEHAAERKKMLQWWSDYVDSLVAESNILIGNFGTA